ncbi:hypothetical protein RJT34_14022 [Clitoria ternatea]|uniref:Transmembrane protein n=1 Tax=Clitoria ternatea TaxID=43366 RepID=A0AAN9JS56_CLITE
MGNLNQTFKCMCITLFFLFLLSYTVSSHSSTTQQIQNQNPSSTTTLSQQHHQVFYLKNSDPMFPTKQERFKKRKIKRMRHKKKKKNILKNIESRPFYVMLPKGFVPPSGSSPCHNDQPNSLSFHCHLTTKEP